MKIFKLILIFAIILGGVVGALYLMSGGTGTGINGGDNDVYQTYRIQFENDWRNRGDWDDSLFRAHCSMVKQLSKEHNAAPLRDLNTTTAVEIVYDKIFKEWNTPTCSKATVDHYMGALKKIQDEDPNATSNPNVQLIKSVNSTYDSALKLATKSVGLSPGFNGSTWNSFSNYSNNLLSQKEAMLNNSQYRQYLSNIKEIKEGLDAIPSKLNSAKTTFYNNLAHAIVSHYNEIPVRDRSRADLNDLREVRNKYNSEYTSNEYLNSFVKRFGEDADQNANRSNGN